jgi:hypothetical protein
MANTKTMPYSAAKAGFSKVSRSASNCLYKAVPKIRAMMPKKKVDAFLFSTFLMGLKPGVETRVANAYPLHPRYKRGRTGEKIVNDQYLFLQNLSSRVASIWKILKQ